MPKIDLDDIIAAIVTPPGEGGVSVIRLSGPGAFSVAERFFDSKSKARVREFQSHTIHLGYITGKSGERLDQVLLSVFKGPRSYTGEDVIEISSHGGMALTRRLLERILDEAEVRLAEPGEFTKRAFLNGRIDLTQAEAVVDLIRAKSEKAMQTALRQLEGALSARFRDLRERLMRIYAHMEAYVDFPEEDIEVYDDEAFSSRFLETQNEIKGLIAGFRRGSLFREGITCVIAGKPNVGKSSLFNALLERDRALVSEYAGTTRDTLEEFIEIGGVLVRLTDTAGLGDFSKHPLDRIGMERTRKALTGAHLVLYTVDGSGPLEPEDKRIFSEISKGNAEILVVINKCDRSGEIDEAQLAELTGTKDFIRISAVSRQGFEGLERRMEASILGSGFEHESAQITRLRHKKALEAAAQAISRAEAAYRRRESLDLVTLDLKEGLDHLGELIGEVYSEDLLDIIFSEFCIGK